MLKEEYGTCMNLHKELKAKIRGRVFIKIEDDILVVYINDKKGIKFKREVKIATLSLDIKYMANKIVNDYKGFIINKFFFTGNREKGVKRYETNRKY